MRKENGEYTYKWEPKKDGPTILLVVMVFVI